MPDNPYPDRGGVLTSLDGKTQIRLPLGWSQASDLSDNAALQGKNEFTGAYFIVIAESRQDLHGWNLERHSRGTIGKLISKLLFPEVTGPCEIIVNGYPGLQYEFAGAEYNGFVGKYLHTTLETPTQYIQVLMWAYQSTYSSNRASFDAILQSIKESRVSQKSQTAG